MDREFEKLEARVLSALFADGASDRTAIEIANVCDSTPAAVRPVLARFQLWGIVMDARPTLRGERQGLALVRLTVKGIGLAARASVDA